MSGLVRSEIRDGTALITLDRPESRNALSGDEMCDALVSALREIGSMDSVRVAILTGAGSAFSAGGDLARLSRSADVGASEPSRLVAYYRNGIQRIPEAIQAFPLPLIAAVNGPAVGAGCDLACMCDIRIAARSARFAESFVKLGIVAGDGGAWFLPRVAGRSKAFEMALTGDTMDAAEALSCGLVSRVVDDEILLPTAFDLAGRIAANPPFAVRMTKLLMREAEHNSLGSVLQLSAALQALAHSTPEHREALDRLMAGVTGTKK
ncbi:enoyl-CoA hydratase [Mesorhizobium sp. M7A.F.Ca.US.006.01.1.1]|uniref:enoyl-CoA hydratase-related protein n=1 Tax=Mesorhizobium sp. M7A.F.Ca.US.006.01.1.1 TaxID=2496707 RepID=UPI000FCA4E9C|nr:enoyl-CoA hydratase-related protein [Mesorhizobium sp. M7A.F.Ca.US.006.01.1.1]RUZ71536.1 enoyl-CoA hydratase [Mesorhizobium sp. M7A.F.Ca.US.006.01.1.1]